MCILSFFVWLLILGYGHSSVVRVLLCGRGEYLYNGEYCESCPDGTFMDQPRHTNLECVPCSRGFDFNREVELKKCTKTKDTVIGCIEDHYMNGNTGDLISSYCTRCQKCGVGRMENLPYLVQNCSSHNDTVCSESLYCGRGQFVSRHPDTRHESCEDCPTGTFMAESRHQNTECQQCLTSDSFSNEVEVRKCTKTADTLIICASGYYRLEPGPFLPSYCERCLECGRGVETERPIEIQPCGTYTNTVCGVQTN